MRRKQTETKGCDVVLVATKVFKEERRRIQNIASSFNMSLYELLQSLLLAFLRYFDSGKSLSYDHNCMLNALANTIKSLKDSYNPLRLPNRDKRQMKGAIAFINDSPNRRPQLLYINQNENGQMIETYNFDEMVSDFLKCIDPDALLRLETKKKELGFFSITHTLHEVIMQNTCAIDDIKTDVGDMFKDIRIPSGESLNDEIYYKRVHRKNVDEYTTITRNQTFRADL